MTSKTSQICYNIKMKISGREIAKTIFSDLIIRVNKLKDKGIIPSVAVILVGDDPSSLSYIKQKQKAAEKIGAKLIFRRQGAGSKGQEIQSLINEYNNDPSIHGIILQRPLPISLAKDNELLNSIKPEKDIDGFVPGSKFQVPVVIAIDKVIDQIFNFQFSPPTGEAGIFNENQKAQITNKEKCMQSKSMVVIGRGETAGKPIADYFQSKQCTTFIINSQTPESQRLQLLKRADIIVSCVGKKQIVKPGDIKSGVILISVGLWNDEQGKLHGDYEEDEIKDIVSFYTPTPGGIGPINIACLMTNLISATEYLNNNK